MPRLPIIDPATATGPIADGLARAKQTLGSQPNGTRAMGNSPALLEGYLDLHNRLDRGVLGPAVRELLAVALAQGNRCAYCLSAHTYIAEHLHHLGDDAISAARKGTADDVRVAAILEFATAVNDNRGGVTDEDFDAARAAGLTDEEIAEIFGHIAINVMTNYFNRANRTDADFPVQEL